MAAVNEENAAESDSEDLEELLSNELAGVRLKQGVEVSKLCSDEGAVFEVDDTDLQERYAPNFEYFNEDSLKYSKYELLGGSSSEDEDEDKDISRTPFEKMAAEMVDITEDASGGILKRILKVGEGKTVPNGSSVTVHYNGYLEFTPEPFDSTCLRGTKCTFRLNSGRVVAGLDKGIQTMRKGEKSYFLIQPEYAFGPMGCPPRIPANATILFEVELLSFIDDIALVEFTSMSPEDQSDASFEKIMKVCQTDHLAGNEYFKQNQFQKASVKYEHGVRLLERVILKNEDEQQACENLQLKLYLNLSLIYLKLDNFKKALRFAKQAVHLDRHNTKALFRLGVIKSRIGEYASAKDLLLKAKQREPHNKDILKELDILNKRVKDYKKTEKVLCERMFKQDNDDKEKAGEEKIDTKPDTCTVTKEFEEFACEQLLAFKDDESETDLLLPEGLAVDEHVFIAKTAKVLGLGIMQEWHTGQLRVKVYKKKE